MGKRGTGKIDFRAFWFYCSLNRDSAVSHLYYSLQVSYSDQKEPLSSFEHQSLSLETEIQHRNLHWGQLFVF